MDAGIVSNIGLIVELKRDLEGIGIDQQGQNSHKAMATTCLTKGPGLFVRFRGSFVAS